MGLKYEVKDVVSDYGVYENGTLKIICNVKSNANKIKDIMESDAKNITYQEK